MRLSMAVIKYDLAFEKVDFGGRLGRSRVVMSSVTGWIMNLIRFIGKEVGKVGKH